MKNKNKNKYKHKSNNRINIVGAIVFLFFLIYIFNLYKIQIANYDFFNFLSEKQHYLNKKLQAERGDILIINNDKKYPIATNKDFGEVFVIPKNVKNASTTANQLYTFFDQEEVTQKIANFFQKKDKVELDKKLKEIKEIPAAEINENDRMKKITEIENLNKNKKKDIEWKKEREKNISKMISIEKNKITSEYYSRLNKKNDPYEPLKKKVDVEVLKKLYAYFKNLDINKSIEERNNEKILDYYIEFNLNNKLSRKELEAKNGMLEKAYDFTSNFNIDNEKLFLKNGKIFIKLENEENTRNKNLLLTFDWISYSMKKYRYYPENTIASQLLGYVSSSDDKGHYGLEGFFDKELLGVNGFMKSEENESNDTIKINGTSYKKPEDGKNLVLTIDRSIQFYACDKLSKAVARHGADSGSIAIINPKTGAIITMCSEPNFNPNNYNDVNDIIVYQNPVISEEYEPGSIFKTLTMAMALNENKITPQTTYEDKSTLTIGDRTIHNSDYDTHGAHGIVDMNYVLEQSLNTGSVFAMKTIGKKTFGDYLKKFGLGEKTGIELTGEVDGNIEKFYKDKIRDIGAATASYGQGITVTSLQILMTYGLIANNGVLMKPYVVDKIINNNSEEEITKPIQVQSVISDKVATILSGMLVNVVEGGHAKHAGVNGYYIGGKTGTAEVASRRGYGDQTIHTFVGIAPIDNPKFVMLVKLNDPKDVRYAASSAAPLFGDIAKFILNYYEIPKTR